MGIIINNDFSKLDDETINYLSKNNKWLDMKIAIILYKILKNDYIQYFKNSIKFILKGEKGKIKGYGSILNDGFLFRLIAKKFNLNTEEFILGRHLFIGNDFRGQGLAKEIKDEQIKYAKKNKKNFIVGFTSNKKNLNTYKKYGAIEMGKVLNIYFFKYEIDNNI